MPHPNGSFPTILDRARPEDIRLDPFPHLVVEPALPPEVFAALNACRPDFGLGGAARAAKPNQRIPLSTWLLLDSPATPPVWRDFLAAHASPAFLHRMLDLFGPHLPRHCPELDGWRRTNPDPTTGLLGRDTHDRAAVLLDSRLEVISPVQGAPAGHRTGHLDTPNRLYSSLLYFRDPEDDTDPPGDLHLYRWATGRPQEVTRYEIPEPELTLAGVVPYRANLAVLFPNSPHALHGAAPRGPGRYTRQYVFTTAELASRLF